MLLPEGTQVPSESRDSGLLRGPGYPLREETVAH